MAKPTPTHWSLVDEDTANGGEVRRIVDDLVKRHHTDLVEASIGLLWRDELPQHKGHLVLAKASVLSERDRILTGFDLLIAINALAWAAATDAQKVALVDHELCHFCRRYDGDGEAVYDDQGRPMFTTRAHDVEEFTEIIRRHGAWIGDIELTLRAIAEGKARRQMELAFVEVDDDKRLRAVGQ